MTNYTQTNIYRGQMQELGLNTKQYANLLDIPYEVVKNIIYDKEGEYSMEISKLLRNTMFKKHQDIENDFDNAKIKAMEIKTQNNDIDYLDWYNNEYTPKLLKTTLHVKTISDFVRKYDLKFDGVKVSNWVYQLLCNKREYEGHHIEPNKKLEFIKQLYDILINGNADNYKATKLIFNGFSKNTQELFDWYKNFDFAEFRKKYEISNSEIANDLHISYSTMGHLATNDYFCISLIRRFYTYVMSMDEYDSIRNEKVEILNWFKKFDFKKYFYQNNVTQFEFANLCDVSLQNLNRIINAKDKQKTLTSSIKKIYNYINKTPSIVDENANLDNNSALPDDLINDKVNDSTCQIDLDNDNKELVYLGDETTSPVYKTKEINQEDLLRKLLISRLTEEEKELIELFGGKIC